MIDFHTHILPNLDDGAKDAAISAALLQMEADQEVKEIVFTPHYYGKRSVGHFLALRNEAFAKIQPFIPSGVKVRLGAEIHFTGVNDPAFESICTLGVEGTKTVLLEFPFTTGWSARIFDRVEKFIADTGYTPIVAHVERYDEVLKNPALAYSLAELGCLLQVNTGAFLDKKTQGFALAMLKHGLVHCLGTDTHNVETRAPDYAAAKEVVQAAGLGAEWAKAQLDMRKILDGELVIPAFSPVKRFLKWYF
jgi:protein-tyrosine phosphatase